MNVLRMADQDLRGKRVLIREDLNVPVEGGKVTSDARMRASLVTLPSSTGTFRSSRIRTRFPRRSWSAMRSTFMTQLLRTRPYEALDQAIVVSSMRLLKPHSLSYQEQTLTSVPSLTRVIVAS